MFLPFFNPLYWVLLLPALLVGGYAQWKVKSTYQRYSQVRNATGLPGIDVARRILSHAGLTGVGIEVIPGELTDHYDPRAKVLRLSQPVASSASVAAEGIVAHEIGHALQDRRGYLPMRLRAGILPLALSGQQFAWLLVLGGLMLSGWTHSPFGFEVALAGLLLFGAVFLFQVITFPVEVDASRRALALLRGDGLVADAEAAGARSVLTAAALTYLAAVLASLGTLLYYATLVFGSRRN